MMNSLTGRRLSDTSITSFPVAYDDLQPGDYWKVLTREGDRPLDVLNHPEDRRYWTGSRSTDDPSFAGNLTGVVLGVVTPLGQYAELSIHTVREHDDGTVSVRPGDGTSNSILVRGPGSDGPDSEYHGYIEHGVWTAC